MADEGALREYEEQAAQVVDWPVSKQKVFYRLLFHLGHRYANCDDRDIRKALKDENHTRND